MNKQFFQTQSFLNFFLSLIKKCNKIILQIYNSDFNVVQKKDSSPLTLADTNCNKLICDNLKKNFPNILIISEENKKISYEVRKQYDWCWLIDPIDGTKEFINRNGQFTVNIGLCYKNTPVFGIVSIPVTGEIYYGIKDIGSFKLYNNIKKKLKINSKNFNKSNLNIVASNSHMNEDTEKFIKKFNEPNLVNVGSSIKLLYVAENKADIYPRLGPTSEWDTCAAHAVVKYAGGDVIVYKDNTLTEKELNYNKENILNPYFIVF